jgi:hypothetical protein
MKKGDILIRIDRCGEDFANVVIFVNEIASSRTIEYDGVKYARVCRGGVAIENEGKDYYVVSGSRFNNNESSDFYCTPIGDIKEKEDHIFIIIDDPGEIEETWEKLKEGAEDKEKLNNFLKNDLLSGILWHKDWKKYYGGDDYEPQVIL